MQLTFLGAARNVTGSCFLIETDTKRVVVDCGYVQERKFEDRNWDPFPVDPASIDALLLTHAHLDHCGLIPRLVAKGFRAQIHATSASAEIATIVMRDSARLQQEDLAYKQKRHAREGKTGRFPYRALYDVEDAEHAVNLFREVRFYEPVEIVPGVKATFYEAGHILGAASILLEITEGGTTRTVLFSGDLGRNGMPILRDPVIPPGADIVVMESTYGDRDHNDSQDIEAQLADIVNTTHGAGGNLIIPSFAVERSQDLLYHFTHLVRKKLIPHTLVFLDSPMAARVTDVFRKHPDLFDEDSRALLESGHHPCDFPGLQITRTREQSKSINRVSGTVCVIAGAGMCTGGRIKHHLKANISRPESTILFVGYQASGTLGRIILEGAPEVRIHGSLHPVKARIAQVQGFSGHAGHHELRNWAASLPKKPEQIYVVHGEEQVAMGFAEELTRELGIPALAPEYKQTVSLL